MTITTIAQAGLLAALLALAATASAHAAPDALPNQGAGAALFLSDDSEGFSTRRATLAYLPAYAGRDDHAGVRYAANEHAQAGWSRSAQQLSGVYRKVDPATANGFNVDAGWSRQGGRGLLTLDAGFHGALNPGRSVELFLNRDWVETRNALEQGVHFTLAGGALEQRIGQHLTLVGMAGYQDFSDGNARRHLRAKLIVQPRVDLGLTLQARYRLYHSGADAGPRTYFNPERYAEAMFAVGWRRRMAGWMGSLTAGAGRQRVGDAPPTPSRLVEMALESPARGTGSLRLRAGLNQSASFGGPDYTWHYAQAEWLLGF